MAELDVVVGVLQEQHRHTSESLEEIKGLLKDVRDTQHSQGERLLKAEANLDTLNTATKWGGTIIGGVLLAILNKMFGGMFSGS